MKHKAVDRFTKKSRVGRHKIPEEIRDEIYLRDNFVCQYCGGEFDADELTIDHLVPLSRGGLDEMVNYVTCCRQCNQKKSDLPLEDFVRSIDIDVRALPIHGDPVINNEALPIQIRLLRKRIFDRLRSGELALAGRSAQKKLEKIYRLEYWQTDEGKALESEFPGLPGHVRIILPEIKTVAKNRREYFLLIELAKSANTRGLINSVLTAECDVESRVRAIERKTNDTALKKRLQQSLQRFERELRRRAERAKESPSE